MSVIKEPDSMTLLGLLVNMLSITVEELDVKHVRLVINDPKACSCRHPIQR